MYYLKMLLTLWKIPIKLRVDDVYQLAAEVGCMRIDDRALQEYIDHVSSYVELEE